MTETEYTLLPVGRRIMIGLLLLLFIVFFLTVNFWIFPINALLLLVTSFQVGNSFFVRGAGAIFFSIVTISFILEVIYDKIGWYKFSMDQDTLTLHYRSSITSPYKELDLRFRATQILYFDQFMWIVSKDHHLTMLLHPPDELEDESFYDQMEEKVEENKFKVAKQLQDLSLDDFESHYLFKDGIIRKFSTADFRLISGISDLQLPEMDRRKRKKQEQQEDDQEEEVVEPDVDYYEFETIMNEAERVETIS